MTLVPDRIAARVKCQHRTLHYWGCNGGVKCSRCGTIWVRTVIWVEGTRVSTLRRRG